MNTFTDYNPKTGAIAATYPVTSAEDVDCAVERAQEAGENWRQRPVRQRLALLARLRATLTTEANCLADTVALEIGKPLQEALGADILPSLKALDWLERNAERLLRERAVHGRRGAVQMPEPFGVVGVIGTWNYPLFLNIAPIAWALVAGNAVVWKPSELATGTALRLAKLMEQAGLPVFLVTGGAETGRALCRAGCDKITFTGGVETGRAILKELAHFGTPAVMELSGNDAMLVCADADIALAARSAVWGRISNAGQSCVAPQRLYVVAEQYDKFLLECQRIIESLRPEHDFGPLRTERLREQVHRLVWEAVPAGARLISGGFSLPELTGFYYAPTLLADCTDMMRVMEQDFFGPVLAVCKVRDESEAIARANDSDMALGASVWTRNIRHGQEIAAQLRVGLVSINEILLDAAEPMLPFGGLRASGFGKQRGAAGLEEFVQWKVVTSHPIGGARRHLFPYREATLPILRGIIVLREAKGLRAKIEAGRSLGRAAMQWKRDEPNIRKDEEV